LNRTNFDRLSVTRPLWFFKKLLEWQREAPLSTPLQKRIEMWRAGYRFESYTLYDLSPAHASEYLPDKVRFKTVSSSTTASTFFINGSLARDVLDDKLLFTKLLSHKLNIPRILALIERGKIFTQGRNEDQQDALSLAEGYGSVILKPSDGSRGKGIYQLDWEPDLALNGRAVTPDEVQELTKKLDNYLITKTVQQAAYAKAICPVTTNTVRVVTLIEADTNEPFVGRAVHRFGTYETRPTDNWSRGGLCALVDLQTGVLGPGVKHAKRTGGKLQWRSHHPDTGEAIEGVRIPYWDEICEALLEAVRSSPFLTYVGWDVAVTDDGFFIIEGNKNTDMDLLQVHGGLLKDPKARQFYEHHRVI
jgi:hypothetical protein